MTGEVPPRLKPEDDADGFYTSVLFAEQQPFALAYLVYGQGDPAKTVLAAAKGGRDCDSIATNAAGLVGALSGIEAFPSRWINQVVTANLPKIDLQKSAENLAITYSTRS